MSVFLTLQRLALNLTKYFQIYFKSKIVATYDLPFLFPLFVAFLHYLFTSKGNGNPG
jgi:hypothetical protein